MLERSRLRGTSRLAIVCTIALSATTTASGEDPPPASQPTGPQITLEYQGINPRGEFSFAWKDRGNHTRPVGPLNWSVPAESIDTLGIDREFRTFCAESLVGVSAGNTYRFEVTPPDLPAAYGREDDEPGQQLARYKAAFIRELYGRYYLDAIDPNKPDEGRAFQIALWEIINEDDLPTDQTIPAMASPFDLFHGTFQVDAQPFTEPPAYIQRAQAMLLPLTADENQFINNTNLAGYQLVRLRGLGTVLDPSAAAQAQFALQNISTGGGGGGAGGPGAGGPSGGFPTVPPLAGRTGGGSGAVGVSGGSPGIFPTSMPFTRFPPLWNNGWSTPPSTVGSPPVTAPPVGVIPTPVDTPPLGTPPENPPTEEPNTNPNPQPNPNAVPAPAGLVLGLIGLGALSGYGATRRLAARLARKN